jgi:N-acetylglutamate synthase-like GNAT family acetyltransferase
MITVRQLGRGDEPILRLLAVEDADFDIAGRGGTEPPIDAHAARQYLEDPSVIHWIAEENGRVIGHLHCQIVRKYSGRAAELLLYEIGVRYAERRRGVGTRLLGAMEEWMAAHQVEEVWVLADNPGAREFYVACGFAEARDAPIYLTKEPG